MRKALNTPTKLLNVLFCKIANSMWYVQTLPCKLEVIALTIATEILCLPLRQRLEWKAC